jgi:hypothetical protein
MFCKYENEKFEASSKAGVTPSAHESSFEFEAENLKAKKSFEVFAQNQKFKFIVLIYYNYRLLLLK